MKLLKFSLLAPLALSVTSIARAHPGHEGGDLVWEYSGGHLHLEWLVWTTLAVLTVSTIYRYTKKQG